MRKLRDYVESLGGDLAEEGWSLTMKPRTTGTQAGLLYDRTFRSPVGTIYRSKVTTRVAQCLQHVHIVPFWSRSPTCSERLLNLPDDVR